MSNARNQERMTSFSKNQEMTGKVEKNKICNERRYYGKDEYNNRIYYEDDSDGRKYYDEYNDPVFYDNNGNRRRPTLKEGFGAYRKDIRDASVPFKTDKTLQKGCWGYGLLALFVIIMILIG